MIDKQQARDRLAWSIRERRMERGMTQAELGAAIGRTANTICNYEAKLTNVNVPDALAIAAALDVPLMELVEGIGYEVHGR